MNVARAWQSLMTKSMKLRKLTDGKHGERGQSLVELAITFMVLLLLLSVAVDLGRLFLSYIAVREAAQEGAVYGSINPDDIQEIEQRVRTSSSNPVDLEDTSLVEVSQSAPDGRCAGNTINVSVVYHFQITMPLVSAIIGTNAFPLSLTASATILRPEC